MQRVAAFSASPLKHYPDGTMRFRALAWLFGLAALAGVAAFVLRGRLAALLGGFVGASPGALRIDGILVPEGTDRAAFVAGRAELLRGRRVRVRVDGDERILETPTLAELGVRVDAAAVLRRSRAQGDVDVPLAIDVDADVLAPLVERLKDVEDAAPVSARLDLEHQSIVPEEEGRYVDPYGAVEAVRRVAATKDADEVVLPVQHFPPRHSSAFVSKIDVGTVLGTWDTYFSRHGDQERRGRNIDVAAQKIDGLVILPGELVSFNDVVGERSEDNGFEKSWEIYKGEMVEGVGGGTCQVASTFFAAAYFGGLDVIERLPHSRPSAYIPMGLDATVVYPIVDLKVRNAYDFPVVMHAQVDGNRLRMSLLGPSKPARVTFVREVLATYPYTRKVEEEPKLRWSQRVVLKQHGIRGYRIKRVRTMRYADGRLRKETNIDRYPATTEIYEIPPGFDEALLPPLPEQDEDEGEGSDSSAAAAAGATSTPIPTPTATTTTTTTSTSPPPSITLADGTNLKVEEGKGSHIPTHAQVDPPKKLTLTR